MEWPLKDEPLMKNEEMVHFMKIAEATGVINPKWSGLTKRDEKPEVDTNNDYHSKMPSC